MDVSPPVQRPVWLPTGNWVLAAIAPALAFIATSLQRNYQTDFWHHLARGRVIVTEGRLLNEDRFTYTVSGQPLQDTNWLTQVLYYRLWEVGGFALVQLVNSLTLAAVLAVLVWTCHRRSGSLRLAAGLGVFAFLGMWQTLIIRPQTFSLLLFLLLLAALEGSDRRRWTLIVPPLILGLWVNLHGGFPIGLVPIGCFLLAAGWDAWQAHGMAAWRDSRVRNLALCLAAAAAATLVNPYGMKVYQYVLQVSGVAAGRPISEWQPPGLHLLTGKLFAGSVVLVVLALATSARRPPVRDVVLLMVFLPLACGAVRMVPWWLLVSLPIVAAQLAAVLPPGFLQDPEGNRPTVLASLFVGLIALVGIACVPGLPPPVSLGYWKARAEGPRVEDRLQTVANRLHDLPGSNRRIYCSLEFGEYLGWALQPAGFRVFMDGRIEIIPTDVWNAYWALLHARGDWPELLRRFEVAYLVLDAADPTQAAGLLPLAVREGWQEVAREGNVVLLARQ